VKDTCELDSNYEMLLRSDNEKTTNAKCNDRGGLRYEAKYNEKLYNKEKSLTNKLIRNWKRPIQPLRETKPCEKGCETKLCNGIRKLGRDRNRA